MAESPCGWYLPITWPVIWIAIDGAEIALAIDQGVAHGEGLGHADQGIVDGGIAVRMVLAHHLAGDFGALGRGAVGGEPHFGHAEEDAAMHRFEAVADIGEGAADDHAHGVIQVRPLHLVFDIDGDHIFAAAIAHSGQSGLPTRGWRRWTLWWKFLICQARS